MMVNQEPGLVMQASPILGAFSAHNQGVHFSWYVASVVCNDVQSECITWLFAQNATNVGGVSLMSWTLKTKLHRDLSVLSNNIIQ